MCKTLKIYDQDSHQTSCQAMVIASHYIPEKDCYGIHLDQTVFFPEGGGQFADLGYINDIAVLDVQISDDMITHYTKEPIEPGTSVTCTIDWKRRFDFMQQHSAEHIISGLVYQKYGYQNVGFHLGMTETTLDFNGPLSEDQLTALERSANEAVYQNIPFEITFPDKDTLAQLDYRSKKALSGEVRIVTLPGYDVCACCAPHVYRSGEIGSIKIVSAMAHRGGMRLTILCGNRALLDYQYKQRSVEQISSLLSVKQPLVADGVAKVKQDQLQLMNRIHTLQKMVLQAELKVLPSPTESDHAFLFQTDLDTKVIRDAVNTLCDAYPGYCGIFVENTENGYTFILGSAHKDCRPIAALLREKLQAKSGGSEKMIQGSIPADKDQILLILNAFL